MKTLEALKNITFLGGLTLTQSGVVVVGGVVTVEILVGVMVAVVIGGGVVKQEYDFVSTSQVALQYAIKHHPKPSVTL